MREPTIARWPGVIPAGRKAGEPSGQWDWMNTFASAAGLPAVASSDGVSLLPALTGVGEQQPSRLYIEYFEKGCTPDFTTFVPAHRGRQRNQMQAIYLNGYKGIRYDVKSADDNFEIYDLAKDPQESRNLAGLPGMGELQASMKARVLQERTVNSSAPRPYDDALVPAQTNEPLTAAGLSWERFAGQWPWLPDFHTLSPAGHGTLSNFNLSMIRNDAPSGVLFQGYFQAPQDGEYHFTLTSDTGAMLFLHDIRVIDEPRERPAGTFSGRVKLQAGWHPIRLLYRHAGDAKPMLDLRCETSAGTPVKLDSTRFRQFASARSDARIATVWLAQTHVMQPDQPYFKLVGNRAALLKADVVSASGGPAPEVTAVIISGGETNTLMLKGPATLPEKLPAAPGVVQHRYEDSFTAMIPARLVQPGLSIEVHAGTNFWRHAIKVGAPTVVHMKMFDVHYFGRGTNDYPPNFLKELESKWPVSELEIERVRGINFPELVIPQRGKLPAVRIASTDEYKVKTGEKFDGKQAAALQWVWALSAAGGNEDVALCYVNIIGVPSGGQAGGFNGVGGPSLGIMHHEFGHALGLPHDCDDPQYPYRGEMYGIKPPKTFKEIHVGPTWAFDLPSGTFIPPTVQASRGSAVAGTYKADPMQGGGVGDQEAPFLLRHFSDYNVAKMQAYLERHVAVLRDGSYYKWDDAAGGYSRKVQSDGVHYPVAQDVQVISVMAAMTMADLDVNMVYPPIGPYRGNLIRTFDPRRAADREAARKSFSPKGGCDFTLKIIQVGKESYYLLPASAGEDDDRRKLRSLTTSAVNVRADDGPVTAVELLYTPKADEIGLAGQAKVLARWPKK
jgi:Peptidase M66/PA14 domain/Domain of unknown function (DUF4976)